MTEEIARKNIGRKAWFAGRSSEKKIIGTIVDITYGEVHLSDCRFEDGSPVPSARRNMTPRLEWVFLEEEDEREVIAKDDPMFPHRCKVCEGPAYGSCFSVQHPPGSTCRGAEVY